MNTFNPYFWELFSPSPPSLFNSNAFRLCGFLPYTCVPRPNLWLPVRCYVIRLMLEFLTGWPPAVLLPLPPLALWSGPSLLFSEFGLCYPELTVDSMSAASILFVAE